MDFADGKIRNLVRSFCSVRSAAGENAVRYGAVWKPRCVAASFSECVFFC